MGDTGRIIRRRDLEELPENAPLEEPQPAAPGLIPEAVPA